MGSIDVKSKFYAEFRRFALKFSEFETYQTFKTLLEKLHKLEKVPICISYHDPKDGDLLPINNDDNYARAISMAKPLLRIIIQKKGDVSDQNDIYKSKNVISTILGAHGKLKSHPMISNPLNFRQVSAIIDVDVVPTTCRRVRLLKNSTERPLGFYIRDGTSVRVTSAGLEKIPGIFISRLVPGGLAESTGLLSINDEVLEVNGIEVTGKTLDQVTDMMVANSHNLIITVKPANQRNTLPARPRRGSFSRSSQQSVESAKSIASNMNTDGIIFI